MEGFIYESPLIFRYALRKFFQNFLCDRKGIELFHRRRKDVLPCIDRGIFQSSQRLFHILTVDLHEFQFEDCPHKAIGDRAFQERPEGLIEKL